MNATIQKLVEVAGAHGIEAAFPAGVPSDDFLRLTKGGRSLLVQKTKSPFLSAVSARLVTDKFLSGKLMEAAGLPVAEKRLSPLLGAGDVSFLEKHRELVVKPNAADRGAGVTLRVRSREGLAAAHACAARHGPVLLEPFLAGREYRVLVIGRKVAGVLEWRPAGNLTENALPGGEVCLDRTEEIHPDYRELALRAAELFSVDVAGIDLICPSIAQPFAPSAAAILEVNPGPDFLWHTRPSEGKPRPVFEMYLDYLFDPENRA